MHHGDNPGEVTRLKAEMDAIGKRGLDEQMKEVAREMDLGATGQFPEGKVSPGDEGEIQIAVGVQGGKVFLNFGKPVAWIGFTPRQARQIAESLRQKSYLTAAE